MLDSALFEPNILTQEDLRAFHSRYANEPNLFCAEILGLESDEIQQEIAQAVHDRDKVAVVSGRGIGKTWIGGALGIWFFATRAGEVRLLANTDRQSKEILWPPLCRILANSAIKSWFTEPTTEVIRFKDDPHSPSIQRMVWSANTIEAISGVHAQHLLFILDEASKMPNSLIENIVSGFTEEDNRILMLSNGTRSSGYFYSACQLGSGWEVLQIDSRRSKWTNKEAIEEMIARHGLDSDLVRVHVLGQFPALAGASIVPDAQILAAMQRKIEKQKASAVVVGMDVGGGLDSTVWVVRDGRKLVAIEEDTACGADGDALVRMTASVCNRYGAARLIVDSTGLGHFLPSRLKKALPGVEVIGRNFGGASPDDAHENMRAWIYFRLREWFTLGVSIGGVSIGDQQKLREELLATEYSTNAKGKLTITPKGNIRAVLDRSPDTADALALSCAFAGDLSTLGNELRRPSMDFSKLEAAAREAADWG